MGIEPTPLAATARDNGFEDRERHQPPSASAVILEWIGATAGTSTTERCQPWSSASRRPLQPGKISSSLTIPRWAPATPAKTARKSVVTGRSRPS
jgi:hypothetical protein